MDGATLGLHILQGLAAEVASLFFAVSYTSLFADLLSPGFVSCSRD